MVPFETTEDIIVNVPTEVQTITKVMVPGVRTVSQANPPCHWHYTQHSHTVESGDKEH